MIEHAVEKVSVQPLVHDPEFIDPSTDTDGAQGILLAVYCTTTPDDGDVAVFVAANNRFEIRPGATPGAPVTVSDGAGGFELVFDEDGNVVYS